MTRHLLVLFMLLASASVLSAQETLTERSQRARSLFESGDTQAAIDIYEAMLADHVHEAAIYMNLGDLYATLQNEGKALLNYRRAQHINPRIGEVNTQLSRIRSLRIDIQGDDTALIDSLAVLTSNFLTLTELAWIAVLLWIGFFITLSLLIVKQGWRAYGRVPLLVLMILTVSMLILWASRAYGERFRPAAIVTSTRVTVRSGPSIDYLEIYDIHEAAELHLLEKRGEWVRFALPDGRQGWIVETDIEAV